MTDKIEEFLAKLSQKEKLKIKSILLEVKSGNLTNKDIKKLANSKNHFRIRIGKIRIIVKQDSKNFEIIDIDYLGNIY
jgi:mRNA-degrading endonuclease RelE of RelBE toxin-antitoxin system